MLRFQLPTNVLVRLSLRSQYQPDLGFPGRFHRREHYSPHLIPWPAQQSAGGIVVTSTNFLYVSDFVNNTVYAFSVNNTSGVLTAVSGSPVYRRNRSGSRRLSHRPCGKISLRDSAEHQSGGSFYHQFQRTIEGGRRLSRSPPAPSPSRQSSGSLRDISLRQQ